MSDDHMGVAFTKQIIEKYPHIFTDAAIDQDHPKVCAEVAHVLGGLMSVILHKKGEATYRQCVIGLLKFIDQTVRETILDAINVAHGMDAPEPPTARYSGREETPEES